MAMHDVCRLCLAEDNLVWVFDGRFENNDHMRTVVMLTTGVEIHKKDLISQNICTKCGQVAIKMFQFRQNSLKNDKYLKDQCRNLLRDKDIKIPNTDVTIKTEKSEGIEGVSEKKEPPDPPYKVHPSLYALSKQYPKTHFPSICVQSHVSPIVSMEMDAVEKYFQARNLKMQDYVRLALRLDEPETSDTSTSKVAQDLPVPVEEINNNKVPPINIVKTQSDGYSVRISVDESDPESNQKEYEKIRRKRRRRLSDDDLSETEPKKATLDPEKSPPVLCEVCSEMFDNSKDLRKHQNRHLRCPYCKSRFPSVSAKQLHVDKACYHKKALGNFPDVVVNKVEYDALARKRYPEAFKEFPPHPESATKAAVDVIEILSDDEEEKMSAKKSRPSQPKSSISVIKPDINISDSTLLDKVGKQPSDVHQLKELLMLLRNGTRSDKSLQTELPQNDSIKVDQTALTVDFAGLKHLGSQYRIPVNVIKLGPLNASYNYEVVKEKPKKLLYWNDLKPIDLKSVKQSVIRQNDRSSVAEGLNNKKRTDENFKLDKQCSQIDESLFVKMSDFCANIISASTGCEPVKSNADVSSIMELFFSGDTTIAPVDAQKISSVDLLTSSESASVGATTPIPSRNGANTTSDFTTITLSNSSRSEVLLPKTSPNNQSPISSLMHSNALTRRTPPNNRLSTPSTVPPKTSPNNQHPLSQIPSNEPITITLSNSSHSEVLLPKTSPNNQSSIPSLMHSNALTRRTPPNNRLSTPSTVPPKTSPNNQHPLSQIPSNEPIRRSPPIQSSMPSQTIARTSPKIQTMPYRANARTSNIQAVVSTQTQALTSPDNQHSMPFQMHERTSPKIQTMPYRANARTSNIQAVVSLQTQAITSPDNQHSMPSQMHARTSPVIQPHTHARTSNNQAAMPTQTQSITSPNNQHSMPSQMHARTSPAIQPHTHARTSNNQAAMPTQTQSITSPNNQHSMPSQMHARTSPAIQPHTHARTSNNQAAMPTQTQSITSPNNQHSMPSQMHARTSPAIQPHTHARTSNNQAAMPTQTQSITSPNNQHSMPYQMQARTYPNIQPQAQARTSPNIQAGMQTQITSPNNQSSMPSKTRARTSPDNQHFMPHHTLARTSPNNQAPDVQSHAHAGMPSNDHHFMPPQTHARTSPNNQAAIPTQTQARTSPNNQAYMPSHALARTSPNNQPPISSNETKRRTPLSNQSFARQSPNNPLFESFMTRPNTGNSLNIALSNSSTYSGMNQGYYQYRDLHNINNDIHVLRQMTGNYDGVRYRPSGGYVNVGNGSVDNMNIPGMSYRGMTPNMYEQESARFVPNVPSNRSHSAIRNDRMPHRPTPPPPPTYNETSWMRNNYKTPVEPLSTKDINNSIRVRNLCELR